MLFRSEFLVRRGRLAARGGVPVIDSLAVLFQHAALLARLRRGGAAAVSRLQMYAQPGGEMLRHVRAFGGQRELKNDFSGDR